MVANTAISVQFYYCKNQVGQYQKLGNGNENGSYYLGLYRGHYIGVL